MRYFIDTEFIEDGKTIDLISIGIVADDSREFYAISGEFNLQKAKNHPFVSNHVLSKLDSADFWKPRKVIAESIRKFVDDTPEFWGDFAAYDWVALCQLFGTMMDLPDNWPMFCRDIQQEKYSAPYPFIFPFENHREHDALYDARDCKARYDYIQSLKR